MLRSTKRRLALIGLAGCLGVVANGAASAEPASAYALHFGSANGSVVPAGTTWNAVNSGQMNFVDPSSGGALWSCQATTLSGVTTATGGLTITGASARNTAFSNCHLGGTAGGATILVNPTFNWSLAPFNQVSTNVFTDTISNVTLTMTCPPAQPNSPTETYFGTLPLTETNQFTAGSPATGSKFAMSDSVKLMKTGGSCTWLPPTVNVSVTYLLTKINGTPVTATNNLWETP